MSKTSSVSLQPLSVNGGEVIMALSTGSPYLSTNFAPRNPMSADHRGVLLSQIKIREMDQEPQVFTSNITRSSKPLKNDLTDLIKIAPAEPVVQNKYDTRNTCDFKPNIDKQYVPKRKSKLKVSTVRGIRNAFEKDVYSTLLVDLEKQQNVLLRKIKAGYSREANTKSLTTNMLKCDKPISRPAWQMITNLNPEEHTHSTQFVLWNGKRIRVNGSKGGACKFLCKYDLGTKRFTKNTKSSAWKPLIKRKGLLQNSLSNNFKPGPLRKKMFLDYSYQKYHVGGIELQNLPKPVLEINPTIGKTMDPTISHFLHNMQQEDGTISEKWAEFTVSVLSTSKNENVTQLESECCVTFDLKYKLDQQQILMRRDVNSDFAPTTSTNITPDYCDKAQDLVVTSEIQCLLDRMLDTVDISLKQDNMYIIEELEEEPKDVKVEDPNGRENTSLTKEIRPKRRGDRDRTRELGRLDVTIIRLGESNSEKPAKTCLKAYCRMGCVCASLQCGYNFKGHCGRIECMFECKCDFSKYKVVDSFERDCSDLLPGLLKLDSEVSSKMAKEEQKFHHTVIVTPENSVLLKSKRRDWKSSRKYADFFSNMALKNECKKEKVAVLILDKLNLHNVEPWCMVHGLYKCFCKGIFTDNSFTDVKTDEDKGVISVEQQTASIDLLTNDVEKTDNKCSAKTRMSSQRISDKNYMNGASQSHFDQLGTYNYVSRCSRIIPYKGRKFSNGYYFDANRKISEMEQHDKSLRKRLVQLFCESSCKDLFLEDYPGELDDFDDIVPLVPAPTQQAPISPTAALPPPPPLTSAPSVQQTSTGRKTMNTRINIFTSRLPDKEKLVAWLEMSYKQYKNRINRGVLKVSLEPPHLGKMALYPWEFILGRYRDKKNLFLITNKLPYRIFMAVDPKNPFFKNCININDIRFADLPKYPVTVKNLLANAKDLKDNFCILSGLSHCWELIGSVTKVGQAQETNEKIQSTEVEPKDDNPETSSDALHVDSEDSNVTTASTSFAPSQEEESVTSGKTTDDDNETPPSDDSSRWFVMTVENDFHEIQFYNKGFFVKLESIIKAINVARASKKTVRLSSQKCIDSTGPQFGIYAIPNENESCVFVGPYEKDEPLGIETVKTISDIRKEKRTRGVWITTKKLENFNVIDNPLSFLPPKNVPDTEMMTLAGEPANTDNISFVDTLKNKNEDTAGTHMIKIYKPITITKTNSFYQLEPNGTLKQISQQRVNDQSQKRVINTQLLKLPDSNYIPLLSNTSNILKRTSETNFNTTIIKMKKKPIAEIAPHIKQSTKCPETTTNSKTEPPKKERGMSILKPEEINKRLMQIQMPTNLEDLSAHQPKRDTVMDSELEMDIENFLATAEECEAPNTYIISDDEIDSFNQKNDWKDVWVECKSIEGLGWLRGRKNNQGLLSFEFPGFKYTEFYMQEEAFAKLNQVLSRKIYIPKSVLLEWHVVETEQDLRAKHMLTQEELGPDSIMTKRGIQHKQELISKSPKKDGVGVASKSTKSKSKGSVNIPFDDEDEPTDISNLEVESQLLEEEGEILFNSFKSSASHIVIGKGLEEVDGLREEIAARLQSMVSDI